MPPDKDALTGLDQQAYLELKKLARQLMDDERRDHTLQPTALLHEAYLRYVKAGRDGQAADPKLFSLAAARAMQRILVEHARGRNRIKRRHKREPLGDVPDGSDERAQEFLALTEALELLGKESERQKQIVVLHSFGEFTFQEIADQLQVSLSTVEKDYRRARKFLLTKLADLEPGNS
jgi:RNA polymerase sigma-70 factor (ECF subfamily)